MKDITCFSLWYFNLRSYKTIPILTRHHQASAGGASISQLQNYSHSDGTPPGFSRWYFNFAGAIRIALDQESLAKKLKYHRLKPGGVGARGRDMFSYEIELPAKARGVGARGRDVSSYEIELPPAKARGVLLHDNILVQRNVDWLRDAFDYKC